MLQLGQDTSRTPKASKSVVDFYAREEQTNDLSTPPFRSGETVRLKGSLYLNSGGIICIDPIYDGGLRPSVRTQFQVGKLEDHPEFSKLIGQPADLTLRLVDYRGTLHFHSYGSTLVGNASPIQIANFSGETLRANALRHIGIEGTVLRNEDSQNLNHGKLTLILRDGEKITLDHIQSKLRYESGVQEYSTFHEPQPGDEVQLTAFVHNDGHLSLSGNFHMSRPNATKEREYGELRKEIKTRITVLEEAIASAEYGAVRNQVGQLALREPTRAERNQIYDLLKTIPKAQCPIYSEQIIDTKCAETLTQAYGENVYAKTQNELIEYAERLGQCKVKAKPGADPSYAYRLLEPAGISLNEQEKIYLAAIDTLLPQVVGLQTDKVSFETKYMLENSLNYLASLGTRSAADRLVGILDEQIKSGFFRPLARKAGDPNQENIIYDVSNALNILSSKPHGLSHLERHLEKLNAAQKALIKVADEPMSTRELEQIIGNLLQIRGQPQAFFKLQLPSMRTM